MGFGTKEIWGIKYCTRVLVIEGIGSPRENDGRNGVIRTEIGRRDSKNQHKMENQPFALSAVKVPKSHLSSVKTSQIFSANY